jgi:hypothetical protein
MKEPKSASELEAMILGEMKSHEAPEEIQFVIVRDGDSWRPAVQVGHDVLEHAEWIAKLVQVADHLKVKYDLVQ